MAKKKAHAGADSGDETDASCESGELEQKDEAILGEGTSQILHRCAASEDPGQAAQEAFNARSSALARRLGIHDPTTPRTRS